MKLTRRSLRRLIESVVNEQWDLSDTAPELTDDEKVDYAKRLNEILRGGIDMRKDDFVGRFKDDYFERPFADTAERLGLQAGDLWQSEFEDIKSIFEELKTLSDVDENHHWTRYLYAIQLKYKERYDRELIEDFKSRIRAHEINTLEVDYPGFRKYLKGVVL